MGGELTINLRPKTKILLLRHLPPVRRSVLPTVNVLVMESGIWLHEVTRAFSACIGERGVGIEAHIDMGVVFHGADIITELLWSPVIFVAMDVDGLDGAPGVLELPYVFFVDD